MQSVLGLVFLFQEADQASGGAINWLIEKFNQGGAFMWPILFCLVLGLAFAIFKFISITRASVNTTAPSSSSRTRAPPSCTSR